MPRRSFADTLRDIRGGEVIDQLDEQLQELVRAVQSTQAGGQITLTMIVAPMKGSSEAVIVKDAIKLKKPENTLLKAGPRASCENGRLQFVDLVLGEPS